MIKPNEGFVFLMTLFTISVISLLLLTCMQHILLYYKAINQFELMHHHFYQLETLAMQLIEAKPNEFDSTCLSHEDSANKVMQRLVQHKGCLVVLGSQQYQYFVEELDDFPCLMAQQNHKKVSTHHRRISLLSIGENRPDSLIQIRQITAIEARPCYGKVHEVPLGISSWRYISATKQL